MTWVRPSGCGRGMGGQLSMSFLLLHPLSLYRVVLQLATFVALCIEVYTVMTNLSGVSTACVASFCISRIRRRITYTGVYRQVVCPAKKARKARSGDKANGVEAKSEDKGVGASQASQKECKGRFNRK